MHKPSPVHDKTPLLPLAALMLAGAVAQPVLAQSSTDKDMGTVLIKDKRVEDAKSVLRVRETEIGKGRQALRDIPQTVTVMTERLMSDRNLDDFREVLKTTAGVSFQAGETGEEDVRLRGFSLGQAGDIYVDGLRDAPLIERDTFNQDRVEVLKGSASMLFGKGSTGGVVNQVNKAPHLLDEHEINLTLGSGQQRRLTGDFNWVTGEDAALRLNAMTHQADNWGAKVDKKGIAPTFRWGIGERDEYSVGLYHLDTDGRPLYNHPWFIQNGVIVPTLPAKNYYGLASDHLRTESTYGTFSHVHRLDADSQIKTQLRQGHYERDLWASAIAFVTPVSSLADITASTALKRTPKGRVGESDLTQAQSDYSGKVQAWGHRHRLIAGVDAYRENALRNQSFAGTASGLNTTVGTPSDGAWRADTRGAPDMNRFKAQGLGVYAQDTVELAAHLQWVLGLRFDHFTGDYRDPGGNQFRMSENLWSPRTGLLYQPDDTSSYYVSTGTSYNTSGDTYQYALGSFAAGSANAKLANTPPEQSRNTELGGKWEILDKKASLGMALFRTEKYNERNTDPDVAATQMLLSGKRHASGMEFNLAGRLSPKWEMFYNHTWIPSARIDNSNITTGNAQRLGDRPALTPKHSASLWTSYLLNSRWRVGGGLNHRSEQSPEGNRNVVAPAFTTLDAMAEYSFSDATTLKFNANNLTNQLYADTLYRGFYGPGAPRTVQVSLKTRF
ncbi:TonB-dependent receptor [Limnohabitans radicicola]|nr:TonB-dependent siderophore receptor [Limnohabitans radicicola]